MQTKYIYCFIRKDLPVVHQLIQIGHACFGQGNDHNELSEPPSLVLFEVVDEKELIEVSKYLNNHKIHNTMFVENDMNDEWTAICSEVIESKSKRNLFKDFKLYK